MYVSESGVGGGDGITQRGGGGIFVKLSLMPHVNVTSPCLCSNPCMLSIPLFRILHRAWLIASRSIPWYSWPPSTGPPAGLPCCGPHRPPRGGILAHADGTPSPIRES